MVGKPRGKIVIPAGVNVWRHELETANALAKAGREVKFLAEANNHKTKTPDILMQNAKWEIKAPRTAKLSAIERNLKKAYRQSKNIVFDSHRMGRLPDKSIQKELMKQFKLTKKMNRLLFVNRKREVIDISSRI